jgi:glycerol-3-phosphate dehydrogenase
VDRLVERDGREAPCRTHEIPLGQPVDPASLTRVPGVAEPAYSHLAGRYGYAAEQVLALAAKNPELASPVLAGMPDLLAEVPFAARNEQARTVGDVLLRRTRLGLLCGRALSGADADGPAEVARALAAELGWDEARRQAETERFAEEADAEGISGR